jgi:glycosyltransferase involved in cell wall biosynthesis
MHISVLMSVYINDNPSDFKQSLDSILHQTLKANEIVIVLDGEVKLEILDYIEKKINDGYNILSVKLEKNIGLGNALKYGLKYCSNELIARMDADDISISDRFEIQYKYFLNDASLAIVGSYMYEFTDTTEKINAIKKAPLSKNDILRFSKFRNPFNHPTVMFKKSVVEEVGSYEDILLFEDYFLWLKILKKNYNVKNIQQPLIYFRSKNLLNRRRGWTYFTKEIEFYKIIYRRNLLPIIYIIFSLLIKLPIRIAPIFITKTLYTNFLRLNIRHK